MPAVLRSTCIRTLVTDESCITLLPLPSLLSSLTVHMRVAQPSRVFSPAFQRISVHRASSSFSRRPLSVLAMAPSQETINGAKAQLKEIIAKTNCQARGEGGDRLSPSGECANWRARHAPCAGLQGLSCG